MQGPISQQTIIQQKKKEPKKWSEKEEILLSELLVQNKANGKTLTDDEMAKLFPDRTPGAVAAKITYLNSIKIFGMSHDRKRRRDNNKEAKGIRSCAPWTYQDKKLLLDLDKEGASYSTISRKLLEPRSLRAIHQKLTELNLSKKYKHPKKGMDDDEEPEKSEPSSRQYPKPKPTQREEQPQQQLSMSKQSGHTTHSPQRREQAQASTSGTKRKQDNRKGSISEASTLQGFKDNPQKKTKKDDT
ncbi:hypothetical protein L207DRAFT_582181 [Hyaloscypha variabilis F]|uniref:Uncharacterized protein n=1 Tax=Hyaloscypha variabilis (strain UAMH 11265 / GT02V1 / F) TaxID=1149755 RepID=A0A2J6RTA4_HYAVF|nr:hypothetical protein L207DRAFT_582181 [Hyaloscypha variabilis F]